MPGKPLTHEQIDALLAKLAKDDDYRALFMRDLGAALKELPGQPSPPDGLEAGCCLMPKALASKATIAASLGDLRSKLQGKGEHKPHLLEA